MKVEISGKAEMELQTIFMIMKMSGKEVDPNTVCQTIVQKYFSDHKDDIAETVMDALYKLDEADEVKFKQKKDTRLFPELSTNDNKVCKKPNHHKKIFPNKVAVVVEDKKGKVYRFESQTEAAKFLGIPQSAISTALSGDGYTHGYRIRKPFRVNGQLPPRQEPPLNA